MKGLLSSLLMLTGLGLVSLTMHRHVHAWPARWRAGAGGHARCTILRIIAAACVALSGAAAIGGDLQLGPIYWSCYAMAAVILMAAIHAYAPHRLLLILTASAVLSATIALLGLGLAPSLGAAMVVGAAP
ncbi:hypothetical protein LPW26_10895 [Rhodopseudomonas sp. HC1]|uniref:hypothetical protein n=1 Tax=Rhodopseudomonas infernalis TaxID=2897386 RepID=UPI001EE8BC42|nr:hypothetical protein [Rhodopseudomonas infernalis]MCG6205147.1 hypothetical protein [Rhodopseudomonas infernalis]